MERTPPKSKSGSRKHFFFYLHLKRIGDSLSVVLTATKTTLTADSTLLNTTMGKHAHTLFSPSFPLRFLMVHSFLSLEISVPAFLLLDSAKQFRVEKALGSGGSATVFKGILLDQDLVSQHGSFDIAIKKVESMNN